MNRIPALDGLRGLAVILVVIGHGVHVVYAAGAVGVTVFFVLSGYLITGILERDIATHGGVRLRRFFTRRARRLLPALGLLVVLSGVAFHAAGRISWWWHNVWPAISYTSDIMAVTEGPERLTWMLHTWSLSVEEHFYMVWPFAVVILAGRSWKMWDAVLAVAVAWRLHLHEDPQRAYFSTDGNAYALILGGVIAHTGARIDQRVVKYGLAGLGLISVATGDVARTWVPVAAAVLTALIIMGSLEGNRLLEVRWLRWFGTISYGLYLWHFPFMALWPQRSLQLGIVSVVIAAASWYLWERRWLEGSPTTVEANLNADQPPAPLKRSGG